MNSPELETHLQDSIQKAIGIGNAYSEEEKGLVTKWIVIAEIAEPNGTRSLYTTTSSHQKTWETQGMLHDCLSRESYVSARDWLGDE